MIDRAKYFKISAIYTLLAALPPVLQLIAQPIIEGADRLSASDFSQIGIAEQVTVFAFTLVLFAMSSSLSRFYWDCNDNSEKYNKLVSGALLSIVGRGILLLLVAFIFKDFIGKIFTQSELQDFGSYGFAAIIIGINRAIYMSAAALYRNQKRIKAFVTLNIALAIIRTGFQITGVLLWDMSFLGYVYGTCVATSIVSITILVVTLRKTGVIYDRSFMKPINQFANPLFQYSLITWALYFVDKYFLESSPAMLGIYITAMNFANGIQLIILGIQSATQPEIFMYMKEGIKERQMEIRSLGNMLILQVLVVVGVSILPITAYIHEFFETDVQLAAAYVAIILVRFIPRSQYFVFSFVVFYEKKTRILFILNSINLIISIALNYFLIPIFNIYGAIIAVLVAEIILTAGIYFYAQKEFPIKWNLTKTLYVPIICLLSIISLEIVKQFLNFDVYTWAILASLIVFGGIAFSYRNELNKFIQRIW